ncbi:MAG: ATP-binding cassette domain-containing protein, partial [Trebonia sp.]
MNRAPAARANLDGHEGSATAAAEAPAAAATPARAVVEIRDLCKSFDGRRVLDNVSLDVHHGEIVAIIGQSGGGKSTLMRCVNLLERPESGSISVAGEPVVLDGRIVCRDLSRLRHTVGM